MIKDKAIKLALEALKESETNNDTMEFHDRKNKAITALEALAEQPAQQEPVAYAEQSILDWLSDNARGPTAYAKTTLAKREDGKAQAPLYTSPPAQQEPSDLDVWKVRALQAEAVVAKFMAPQPVQRKPFAWANTDDVSADTAFRWCKIGNHKTPLYTSPLAQRKPLTNAEIERIYDRYGGNMMNCTRAIERAHGIKENT